MTYIPRFITKQKEEINLEHWNKLKDKKPDSSGYYRCLYYDVDIKYVNICFRYFNRTKCEWYNYYDSLHNTHVQMNDPFYWQIQESDLW